MLLFEGGLRAIQLTLEEINLRHTSPALLYALFIGFVNYMQYYSINDPLYVDISAKTSGIYG